MGESHKVNLRLEGLLEPSSYVAAEITGYSLPPRELMPKVANTYPQDH